jgi:FkbH-like protein
MRNSPLLEKVAGCFINFLPLRLTQPAGTPLQDAVQATKRALAEAVSHGDIPVQEIVAELARKGAAGHDTGNTRTGVALYQSMLQLLDYSPELEQLLETNERKTPLESDLAGLLLRMTLFTTAKGTFVGELCFPSNLLDRTQAHQLAKHFEHLLRLSLRQQDAALNELAQISLADASALTLRRTSKLLVVAGSFTVDLIEAPLRNAAKLLGASIDVTLAGFGQVMQSLLNPSSEFHSNSSGINLLFVRAKDFPDPRELNDALVTYDQNPGATAPLVLIICPQLEPCAQWRAQLKLATCSKVWPIDPTEFCTWGASDFDERYERLVSIPYSESLYAGISVAALRAASCITRRPFKIVCVDCDNTLWHGIVGEDGPAALLPNLTLQNKLKSCSQNGLLLVTCSKNVLSDVDAAFHAHPDWPLTFSDFVLHKVNWQPKGFNVREAASELGISELEAVVFIDDNPVEIANVQSMCPEVSTLLVPDHEDADYWAQCWPLDTFRVTTEDSKKATMMKTELERKQMAQTMTFSQFIDSLELRVHTALVQEDELPRVLQMTQKTNQFNFTTERLASIPRGSDVYVTHVADKYGDYGLVGVAICHTSSKRLVLDNMLMSCRVLGRGVEARMLSHVGAVAAERGLHSVNVRFIPTERNEPARNFLKRHNLLPEDSESQDFPTDAVNAVVFDPSDMDARPSTSSAPQSSQPLEPQKAIQQAPAGEQKASPITARGSDGFHRLACALSSSMSSVSSKQAMSIAVPNARPDSALTRRPIAAPDPAALLETVFDVLSTYLDELPSPDVPLMDAGVKSLTAVLIARNLSERVDVPLPPTLIYSHPTAQDIVQALLERLVETAEACVPRVTTSACASRSPLIEGLSGRLPGSLRSSGDLHRLTGAAANAVTQIPATRWVLEDTSIAGVNPLWGMSEIRFNAFVPTAMVAAFDNVRFNIPTAEARAMDPQQRLLLELGYAAVHMAGHRTSKAAAQRRIAVAIGMQNIDYEYMSITGTIPSSTYGATGEPSCRLFPCPCPCHG